LSLLKSRLLSVGEDAWETLIRRGVDGGKIKVVTNGVDVSRFRPMREGRKQMTEVGQKTEEICGFAVGLNRPLTRPLAALQVGGMIGMSDHYAIFDNPADLCTVNFKYSYCMRGSA
jgi:glycosyltransferase involved in cell wall biosynthesis